MTASHQRELQREISIQCSMSHPNIAKIKEVYMDEGTVRLILEYLRGGTLLERLHEQGPFCEAKAAQATLQLLSAIEHVHSQHFMHRDVKPENVVYVGGHGDASHLKLIDFGLATWLKLFAWQVPGVRTIQAMAEESKPLPQVTHTPGSFQCNYEMTSRVIGTGASGSVSVAVHKQSGEEVAVKTYNLKTMTASQQRRLHSEISTQCSMNHPNIARIKDVYMDEGAVHLVLEYLRGGTLFERLKEQGLFCEAKAAQAILQLLSSLEHVHSQNFMHRDVKPENVVYVGGHGDASHLKLIDFGLATSCSQSRQEPCGTPVYAAPEVYTGIYGSKADMWSVGVVTHALLTGNRVFTRDGKLVLHRAVKQLSPMAQHFIKALLRVNPDRRLSVQEALAHPWLQRHMASTSPAGALCAVTAQTSKSKAQPQMWASRESQRQSPRTWWKNPTSLLKAMKSKVTWRANWMTAHIGAEKRVVPSHSSSASTRSCAMGEESKW
eukprot:CAMPEP_0195158208 /NCGR_PEP_ID=MMETSP0448-20130528/185547_1 /TAXON_ID=66468 /ORGANISM="Heterocapsa triquestra, Strain CCMP 448" /LENGTH=493 /DNA_ID=CAMNT_0040197005 /DNA_START=48 /DNA_END=1527 /DNA_ORIENTATION=+